MFIAGKPRVFSYVNFTIIEELTRSISSTEYSRIFKLVMEAILNDTQPMTPLELDFLISYFQVQNIFHFYEYLKIDSSFFSNIENVGISPEISENAKFYFLLNIDLGGYLKMKQNILKV